MGLGYEYAAAIASIPRCDMSVWPGFLVLDQMIQTPNGTAMSTESGMVKHLFGSTGSMRTVLSRSDCLVNAISPTRPHPRYCGVDPASGVSGLFALVVPSGAVRGTCGPAE